MNFKKYLNENNNKNQKLVGFWYNGNSEEGCEFPKPIENSWNISNDDKQLFLEKLENVCKYDAYKGWSSCRICKCHNGSREFFNNNFRWPSGYKHYLKDHNVKPDDDFFEYINNF